MERLREWERLSEFPDKSLRLTIHSLKKALLAISTLSSIRYQSVCVCVSVYIVFLLRCHMLSL